MKQSILFTLLTIALFSCTDNKRAKSYGGTTTITLRENQKLINITWKETDLWYLTRPMNENDSAETYTFNEESSIGLLEGTIVIKEVKTTKSVRAFKTHNRTFYYQ